MKTTVAAIGNLLVFTLSNLAAPCSADDVGSTMAALKDVKSECRYYMSLCSEFIALSNAGQPGAALKKMDAIVEADRVLKAKHDKEPACIKQCDAKLAELNKK